MENNDRLSGIRKNAFPIHKHELKKFVPLTFIFFMISFNYSILRSLKDIYVLEHASAEVIYNLKLFGVTPVILLFTLLYNRISKLVDRDTRFNIIIAYFFTFFLLSYFFFIPHFQWLRLDSLADRLNIMAPSMKSLWESVRYWPASLFYINSEAWGSMVLGVLFWTFVNEITGVEQSKRFYSFLSLGAAVGLIVAGILLKSFQKDLNIVLGCVVGLVGIIWITYNRFAHNIKTAPESYQLESRPKKKKEKLSFSQSFNLIIKSNYIALIATIVICYGVVISLFEAVWKSKMRAFTGGDEGMLASIYGDQGIASGVLAIILIIFLSTPIMNRGWRFAASITPVVTLGATIIFFSFLYFQDSINSITAIWAISPLYLAVTFGLMNVVFIKTSKYTLFDPTKEQAYVPLGDELKVRGKAAVDGFVSRLGKSFGSLIITLVLTPLFGSIHKASYVIFFIIIFMLVLWLRAVNKLSVLFKRHSQSEEHKEAA